MTKYFVVAVVVQVGFKTSGIKKAELWKRFEKCPPVEWNAAPQQLSCKWPLLFYVHLFISLQLNLNNAAREQRQRASQVDKGDGVIALRLTKKW